MMLHYFFNLTYYLPKCTVHEKTFSYITLLLLYYMFLYFGYRIMNLQYIVNISSSQSAQKIFLKMVQWTLCVLFLVYRLLSFFPSQSPIWLRKKKSRICFEANRVCLPQNAIFFNLRAHSTWHYYYYTDRVKRVSVYYYTLYCFCGQKNLVCHRKVET